MTARERKEQRAIALRANGYSIESIADDLGVRVKTAEKLLDQGLTRLSEVTRDEIDKARRIELARLDSLIETWGPMAKGRVVAGKELPPSLKASELLLRIMERRSRLMGLDAPAKQQIDMQAKIQASPVTIDADNLTSDEQQELIRLIEKAQGEKL